MKMTLLQFMINFRSVVRAAQIVGPAPFESTNSEAICADIASQHEIRGGGGEGTTTHLIVYKWNRKKILNRCSLANISTCNFLTTSSIQIIFNDTILQVIALNTIRKTDKTGCPHTTNS